MHWEDCEMKMRTDQSLPLLLKLNFVFQKTQADFGASSLKGVNYHPFPNDHGLPFVLVGQKIHDSPRLCY